jgi:hypothetical protein
MTLSAKRTPMATSPSTVSLFDVERAPALRAGRAHGSWSGSLGRPRAGVTALLLLLAAPACQVSSGAGEGGGTASSTASAGGGGSCVAPSSSPTVPPCGACDVGCYAITPQISICPDWTAPVAVDCSADVAKADNECACEGRTCPAGQQCYKALVAWDGPETHNVCGPDPECGSSSDCAAGQVCAPPFRESAGSAGVILASPGGVCITPECQTDADCTAAPCGVCTLALKQVSINSGRVALDGIKCLYGELAK